MPLKVTGYKTAMLPSGFNDFESLCSLSRSHIENSHWCSAYYSDNPCAGHARDYSHEGQLTPQEEEKSFPAQNEEPFKHVNCKFCLYDVMPNPVSIYEHY